MKKLLFCFIGLLTILAALSYAIILQSKSPEILSSYQEKAPFQKEEMSYRYISRPWFGKGVVFHQVIFPNIPFNLSVDRMSLSITPLNRTFRLSGITAELGRSLIQKEGDNLTQHLKQYKPPKDFLLKPLETLILLGIDTLKGTAEITISSQGEIVNLSFMMNHQGKDLFSIRVPLFNVSQAGLFSWVDGKLQKGNVQIIDRSLIMALASYYTAAGLELPVNLRRSIQTGEKLDILFDLEQEISLSSLFKGNTYGTNIESE